MEQALTADGREHVVTFHRELHISGRDRRGHGVQYRKSSSLCPSSIFGPIFRILDRRQSRQGKAGTFAMAFDRTDIEHGVQIEALGLQDVPHERCYPIGGPDRVLDIRLRPCAALHRTGPRPRRSARSRSPRCPFRCRLEQLDGDIFNECAFNKPKKDEDDDNDDSVNKRGTSGRNGAFEIASQLEPYVLVIVMRERLRRSQSAGGPAPGFIRLQRRALLTGRARAVGKASRRLRHRSPPHSSDGRG